MHTPADNQGFRLRGTVLEPLPDGSVRCVEDGEIVIGASGDILAPSASASPADVAIDFGGQGAGRSGGA